MNSYLQYVEVDDVRVVGVVVVGLDQAGAGGVAPVRDALVELHLDDGVAVGGVLQYGAEDRLLVALYRSAAEINLSSILDLGASLPTRAPLSHLCGHFLSYLWMNLTHVQTFN